MRSAAIENTETKYFFVKGLDRVETVNYQGRLRKRYFYWAECKRCGNQVSVLKAYLAGNRNQSCGCLMRRHGADHRDWKGVGELSMDVYGGIARSAKVRGYSFTVSPDFLWNLFQAQGGKCALTGMPLVLQQRRHDNGNASLDRIRNEEGYTEDNVRWVLIDVNLMKRTLTDEQLLFLCRKVVSTVGGSTVDTPSDVDLGTGMGRRKPRTRGTTKRKLNAKKKMPPRWWHNIDQQNQ